MVRRGRPRQQWERLALWLSLLLHRHGDRILRVKGLFDVGLPGPVVVDGVQHVVQTPTHQRRWSGSDRRSRTVFIVRGLAAAPILRSLQAAIHPAEARLL